MDLNEVDSETFGKNLTDKLAQVTLSKDNDICIVCNLHFHGVKSVKGLEYTGTLEDYFDIIQKYVSIFAKQPTNNSNKATILTIANNCFSGRLHNNQDEHYEECYTYKISASNESETSSIEDDLSPTRIDQLHDYLNQECKSDKSSQYHPILRAYTRFYSELKKSTPHISGSSTEKKSVKEFYQDICSS